MDGPLRPVGLRCHADCGDKTRPTGEDVGLGRLVGRVELANASATAPLWVVR